MDSYIFMIILQVFLIALNAVFACAEIAVISMNDTKLAKMAAEKDKRAMRLEKLTSQPARFLATIQVAITLSGFLGSAFAAENFSDGLVKWLVDLGVTIPEKTLDTIAVVFITLVLSYFTLVFGELVPKRVAMRKAESLALGISGLISTISTVFAPIVWFLTASTNGILRLLGIDPDDEDENVSEEEIRMMVDVGSEKGTIDPDEKKMIQNVFEFDDLTAGEIATHRTDFCVLWMEESLEEWENTIHDTRHTLYPVCEDSIDNIIGILNAKDYFRLKERTKEILMEEAVRPAYFVPETVKADVLFKNMKQSHNKLAVVLDEYGGVIGMVTINDLVEQLVGELIAEESQEESVTVIEVLGENTWKVHGSATLEELEEIFGVEFKCEDYDTFNGLMFHELGRVPKDGTTVEFDVENLHVQVTKIENHQIEEAIVVRKEPEVVEEEEE